LYLTHSDLSKYFVLDIETDSLAPTVIWCIVIQRASDQRVWKLSVGETGITFYKELHDLIISFGPEAIFIGHNAVSFDIPVINRFTGLSIPTSRVVDTLVLSYLYNPHLDGGHSLDSWGERLGFAKGNHEDWSKFTHEMFQYCERDVQLTLKVFLALTKKMRDVGFSEKSCWIEHEIRHIIDKQEANGVWFNTDRAWDLHNQFVNEQADLTQQIQELFPPRLALVKKYPFRRTQDGRPYASYERHLQAYPVVRLAEDESEYETFDYETFNIASPTQRISRLLELGWEPVNLTEAGNPKIDEDALVAFAEASGEQGIKAIAEWLVLQGRVSMLKGDPDKKKPTHGWLDYVKDDHRIHGRIFSCGASSRRMRHQAPNTANIPSAANGAKYGHEMRSVWGCTPNLGRVLVGYDATGLENVGLCHYLNNQRATDLLTKGDVHTQNMNNLSAALGFQIPRGGGGAKNLYYAFIYGAGKKKLGSIIKRGLAEGDIVAETLRKSIPGMDKFLARVESEFDATNGLLRTIDGGFVRCPSPNAALNYKVQSLGGIVMKLTSILLGKQLEKDGLWHMKVIDVHDEGQHECNEADGKRLGEIAVECISKAAEELNFNVRLTGDFKVGQSWAETH